MDLKIFGFNISGNQNTFFRKIMNCKTILLRVLFETCENPVISARFKSIRLTFCNLKNIRVITLNLFNIIHNNFENARNILRSFKEKKINQKN